ncbi:MAG: sarcosine oxidase subunit gamma family protein [Pseudomonadota bacterium]
MSDPVSALMGERVEPRSGLVCSDVSERGQITLKADLEIEAVRAAINEVVGVVCPDPRGAVFSEDNRGAVWMAGDELLLFVPRAEVASVTADLTERLADLHAMVLDVSDARAILRLTGPDAAETLAKGTPVDLRDAAFPIGLARRTHLAGLAVGIWRRDADVWEVVCFRSYAHHLFAWLAQVGQSGAEVQHAPLSAKA